ncbi:MAG: FAD-binding protein [Promethearchaeia archaeon]
MRQSFFQKVFEICDIKDFSFSKETLETYSKDTSFFKGKTPACIVWVESKKQIEDLLRLANNYSFHLIPISSNSNYRMHGDTIPRNGNSVILNLSKMDKILKIDRKNRSVKIQPGVTYKKLNEKLKKKGLRPLLPLFPRAQKSALMGALDREPITIPRYHWDSSDPLLCTELFFGSGHHFRTGSAAGPGTIEQQEKMGQAQVNPMGPTQFSPYRILQGSQGSIGIVLWGTIKVELKPDIQQAFHLQSNNLAKLLALQYKLIKYRLCDELLILNNLNLATLIRKQKKNIYNLRDSLKDWHLIFVISGRGELASEKISYLTGDIEDIVKSLELIDSIDSTQVKEKEILTFLSKATSQPWRFRLKGGVQDIQYLINYQNIEKSINIGKANFPEELGIYIQPINQGTSYYCELDIYYNPTGDNLQQIKDCYMEISKQLIENGCFFNRPYGILTDLIYENQDVLTVDVLKKVKNIFDPNNILNPGVLCFDKT